MDSCRRLLALLRQERLLYARVCHSLENKKTVFLAKTDQTLIVSDSDSVPVLEFNNLVSFDTPSVDGRPVRTAKIADSQGLAFSPDQGVVAGDLFTLEQDIISWSPTDDHLDPGQAHGDTLLEPSHKYLTCRWNRFRLGGQIARSRVTWRIERGRSGWNKFDLQIVWADPDLITIHQQPLPDPDSIHPGAISTVILENIPVTGSSQNGMNSGYGIT